MAFGRSTTEPPAVEPMPPLATGPIPWLGAGLGLLRDPTAHLRRLRARLGDTVVLPARELVSTFGHGRHACPAQRFSISAIRIAIRRLLDAYDLTPQFRTARPLARQIGGVARAARPCRIAYVARPS